MPPTTSPGSRRHDGRRSRGTQHRRNHRTRPHRPGDRKRPKQTQQTGQPNTISHKLNQTPGPGAEHRGQSKSGVSVTVSRIVSVCSSCPTTGGADRLAYLPLTSAVQTAMTSAVPTAVTFSEVQSAGEQHRSALLAPLALGPGLSSGGLSAG